MRLKDLQSLLHNDKKMRLAVVAAEEENVLIAVDDAFKNGVSVPILIGNEKAIKEIAKKADINIDSYQIINANSLEESAEIAVKMVKQGQADFLIKGLIDTSILVKQVLNKEYGLRTGKTLSHVMVYDVPQYHKLLFLTDGGIMTYPDLDKKKNILENAVEVLGSLKYDEIKVACLAAKEKLNPKMPPTVDGDALKKMYLDGEFEKGVIVEGPISFDLAISKEAASIKKYNSPVAGDADVLLVPNIEMGNGIGKTMTYFGNAISAGVIMGASAPVVLVSRADSYESKYYSILLGALVAQKNKE
ncbi:bifunctional enoyl-CoA hydratase/phosphate acetyltransferase [Sedimentibacter sp. zth1]|uniref:bifunctional enoyl-CoA hydratase/phosphate acetyltransferase n=1 Tax=Sedimentibacter sp. zth1 TaxID=2816908 RepID=UPI001A933782|nr:bifunctional enoyl-CoA hydratase/phosphate acetyltransferase [Sedimentibacter sp. zth1]QSX06172.1 bifunctional enoyl-CoA hydratase/phosphate acetyltransferase [Sedimentibacter sp. zth1]